MSLIGTLLGIVLTVFIVLLIARMVLDWVEVLGGRSEWARRGRRITHASTEPVIAPVRRVLPPLRAGGMSIDLAFTVVFLLALVLRSVAFAL
ncbi:YggT family protein [Nocardia sp. BMG111209]|uniref:YggT family protein n=1 Tax=Nocardia sp. BMG111209 TaxID=1160137 RepID=UPI00037DE293|nr:YggT family protein [Nocardia sp. BMG111209]